MMGIGERGLKEGSCSVTLLLVARCNFFLAHRFQVFDYSYEAKYTVFEVATQ